MGGEGARGRSRGHGSVIALNLLQSLACLALPCLALPRVTLGFGGGRGRGWEGREIERENLGHGKMGLWWEVGGRRRIRREG